MSHAAFFLQAVRNAAVIMLIEEALAARM
ncbi:protein of unknown function (plasmid) [Shinella sp. WSC3-e]|nr:protein of unknown function [Shinella sp. WSC3-e]